MPTKSRTDSMSSTNYYVVVALVVAIVVLATAYFGQMLVKQSVLNSKVLTKVDEANAQLTKNIDAAHQLVSNYNDNSDIQGLVQDALPKEGDYPGLIALLENAGNAASVRVKTITPAPPNAVDTTPTAVATYQPYVFGLQAGGSYAQLLKFFNALELSARPIQITDISLSGTGSQMTAQVDGMAYYQADVALPFSTETIK